MNWKKRFLLTLVLMSCLTTYAQTKVNKDTATVNALIEESKSLVGNDSAKAISLAVQAKDIANEINYHRGEAYALKNIGLVYYLRGKYAETLDFWNQSLQIFEEMKDDVGIANILSNIGAVYLNQGADAKALEYSLRSLQIAEKIGDTLRMITALSNVGGIYYNKKDPVALNYLLKAIPLLEGSNHVEAFVVITGNIGEIYADKNDNQKALEYYQKSIKAADTNYSSAFSVNGIGKVYLKEKKLALALQSHNKALDIAKKFDDKLQEVRALRGIADVYMEQGNISLAINYYEQARTIAEQMDDVSGTNRSLPVNGNCLFKKQRFFKRLFI